MGDALAVSVPGRLASAVCLAHLPADLDRDPEVLGLALPDVMDDEPWAALLPLAERWEQVLVAGGPPERQTLIEEIAHVRQPAKAWVAADAAVREAKAALDTAEQQASNLAADLEALRRPLLWGRGAYERSRAALVETQALLAQRIEGARARRASAMAAVEARHAEAQRSLPSKVSWLEQLTLDRDRAQAALARLGAGLCLRLAASLVFVEDEALSAALEARDLETRVRVSVHVRRLATVGAFTVFDRTPQAMLQALTADESGLGTALIHLVARLRAIGERCGDWQEGNLWRQVLGPLRGFLTRVAAPRTLVRAPTWRASLPAAAASWLALDRVDGCIGAPLNALTALGCLRELARSEGDAETGTRAAMQFSDLWRAFQEARGHLDGSYFEHAWGRVQDGISGGAWPER
ncbi:MAG: hypothetical protein KC549_02760 [Myxococcales bacterium]|nr:hypothetical protein [Myxococcales bacterium]MCB9547348.1 hypothetical protein [Myxococcales bacterium]